MPFTIQTFDLTVKEVLAGIVAEMTVGPEVEVRAEAEAVPVVP